MISLRKVMRCSVWLLLLISIILIGCSSYISKEAKHRFQAIERPFSVTVYPVNVVLGESTVEHDKDIARKIIMFLRKENLADPVLGRTVVEIPVKWGNDQSGMAKRSAITFASIVKEIGIETEYALLVEILCNQSETKVRGVHFYLSDRTGNLANGGLTNSNWEEFKEVQPLDRQGGYEVVIRMLRNNWKDLKQSR